MSSITKPYQVIKLVKPYQVIKLVKPYQIIKLVKAGLDKNFILPSLY